MKTETHEKEQGTKDRQRGNEKAGAAKSQGQPQSQEEIMKRVQAAGTPGPAHQALKALEGQWKAEVKCWMEPGAEPKTSQGKATVRPILNGHFIEEEFHGDMFGKPFTGRWLIGYDNLKQKFTSVWLDDAGTAMTWSEGKGENNNKVITLEGKTSCPKSGRTDLPMKQVFHLEDPNERVCEMFVDGKKNMEIVYRRQ